MRTARLLAITSSLLAMVAVARTDPSLHSEWKPNFPDRSRIDLGAYVFEQNCAICHGPRGDGRGEMAAPLTVKPRSFRSGIFKYTSTPPGKLPTNQDLARTIRGGVTGTAMGMFTALSEPELNAVIEFIKTFSRRWRKEENYAPPVVIPPAPEWFDNPAELAARIDAGKKTFAATCAVCHGESGKGDGPGSHALSDAWGNPIRPASLRASSRRTGNERTDLARVLITGIGGTPMPGFAHVFTDEQRWELVAYVESLKESAATSNTAR